jgi:hypothetical protein
VTVNDVAAFKAGFADHNEIRRQAGVRAERVRHANGDDKDLTVELDFDSAEEAEAFLAFARENIWKGNPTVVGTPSASILQPLDLG